MLRTAPSSATAAPALPYPPSQLAPFTALRINILWFTSLLFSLITASIAMLVKMWLREYTSQDFISPQERCRIRHFRAQGVRRWKLYQIANYLPFLLQISLMLFFIGLSEYLRTINHLVGFFLTGFIVFWFFVVFFTIIVSPIRDADSPFKTPLFRSFTIFFRHLFYRVTHVDEGESSFQNGYPGDDAIVRRGGASDVDILIQADQTFQDDHILEIIRGCLIQATLEDALRCVRFILTNRLPRKVNSLKEVRLTEVSVNTLKILVNIIVNALHRKAQNAEYELLHEMDWSSDVEEAFDFVVRKAPPMEVDIAALLERLFVLGQGPVIGGMRTLCSGITMGSQLSLHYGIRSLTNPPCKSTRETLTSDRPI